MFGMGSAYNPSAPEKDKPSGMEQMVAKMMGFTPDEMAKTITGFRDTIVSVRDLLTRVEMKQDEILTRLEGLENGNRITGDGNAPGRNRKRVGTGGPATDAGVGSDG